MADVVFTNGLDELRGWESDTFKALLASVYDPDPDSHFVADMVSYEIADGGYSRQTLTTMDRVVNTTGDRIEYYCDDVDFGAAATASHLVVYREVTNDADSILVAAFELTLQQVATLPNVAISNYGLLWVRQAS